MTKQIVDANGLVDLVPVKAFAAKPRKNRGLGRMLAVLLATTCFGGVAHATDGTWGGATDGEWTDATNWSSNPLVPDDVATFDNTASTTSIFNNGGFVSINTMTFTGTAPAFDFSINNGFLLSGNGVQNASASTQTFNVYDTLFINNSATFTGDVALNNYAFVYLLNNSSTGSATVANNDILQYFDSSTAGSGTITNNAGMDFFDTTSAGSSTINNSITGTLTFNVSASAQTATIANASGTVEFGGSATAANAAITNTSGALNFRGTSTAGAASVTTDSGTTSFFDSASGGTATFLMTTGGTLDISGLTAASTTVGSIAAAFADGIINLGTKSLHVGGNNASTTFGGLIQDSGLGGSIYKEGTGTLTLTFANSYTGGTTIAGGKIAISADNNLGDAAGGLTLQSGGILLLNAAVGSARDVSLGTGGGTIDTNGNSETWSGTFTGTGGFTKAGTGVLTLSGAASYSGATAVNTGTLQAGAANVFSSSSAYTVAAGAILDLNSFSQTVGSLAGAGNVTLGTGTLTEGGDNSTTNYSGVMSGTGGLTKEGTGTTTLSNANTYSGATTVNAGTLKAGVVNAFGNLSAVTVAGGATLDLNSFNQTIGSLAGAGAVTLGTATLTEGGDNSSTSYSGVMSGTGGLTKAGTGTTTLSGANTYSGATNVNAGTLKAGAVNTFGNLSAVTVAGGAILDLNSFNQTVGSLAGAGNVTLGTATLTEGGNNSSTAFSGVISGSGGLTKAGTGTTTLSGANAYTGSTTVNAGTLKAGAANTFGNLSAVTVAGGATLDLNSFNQTIGSLAGAGAVTLGSATLTEGGDNSSTTYSGVMSGTGGLTKAGTGTTTLSGANSYSGATNVNAGTLKAGAVNTFGNLSAVTVAGGTTLDLNSFNQTIGSLAGAGAVTLGTATLTEGGNNSSTTYSGVMSGTGGLTKAGTGTTTLSGANTYSGATNVNAGTLKAGAANTFSSLSAVTVAAGTTLDLNSFNQTVGSLAGAGAVTLGTATLTEGGDNSSTTFSGGISGTGGLTKAGTGTTTLSGANAYTGSTTVNAGTLRAGAVNVFGSPAASLVIVAAGATLDLNSFNQTIGSLAGAGNVTLGSATLTAGGDGNSTTFSGVISGTGGLNKAGVGVLTLSGVNTYSGGTTLSLGSLQASADNNLGAATGGLTFNGGLFLFGASFTVAATRTTTLGAGGGTIHSNGFNAAFAGAITGAGTLTKAGAGTLTLSGMSTYTGATAVNTGTLRAGAVNAFSAASAFTVAAGTTLDLNNFNQTIGSLAGAGFVTLGSATLTEGGDNSSTTYSGVMSGSGGLTKAGTGTTTLSGANAYTGSTTVNAGTLKAGAANTFGNLSAVTVAGGATLDLNSFNQTIGSLAGAGAVTLGSATLTEGGDNSSTTYSGVMSGTGGLTKAGTGTTTLMAANTYSGATTVNGGTLKAGIVNAFGTLSAVTLAAGTTLDLNSFNQTIGSLAGAGNVTLGTATLTEGGNNSSTAYSGAISGTGGLTKAGTGATTLSGANTYSGATAVNTGTLRAGAVNSFSSASAVTVAAGATLDLNGFNQAIASLSGAGNVTLGTGTLTTGGDNSSTTFSGAISGTGGLTKVGTGTFTLSGVSSYSGATLISAGVLSVNGSIANSIVTIGANGTLKGTGTVGGIVLGGGTLAPGNSIGTLNVAGNVNIAAGTVYQVEANAAGMSDKIVATGATTIGGGTVQGLAAPGNYANSTTYVIITSAGGVTGAFSGATSSIPYLIPTLTYKPTEVDLTLTIINLVLTAQTPNQVAVSSAVQAGGVFSTLYTVLFPLNPANSRLGYDALSGEIHASLRSQALTEGETVRETVLGRMRDSSGDTGNGIWVHAFNNWDKLGGNANAATLGGNFGGILVGADTDIGGNVRLGVDAGYTHTAAVVNARGSALTANNTHAGVYGALRSGDFSFGVAAQGAWGTVATMRSVAFPGFADFDSAKQDARTLQAVAEAGYHSTLGSVALDPFANFGWISVNNGAFAETGGASALSGGERESDVTFSNLGLRAGADFLGGGGLHIMPNASVAWQHGFGGLTPARALVFQSIAQGFTVTGVPLDADEAVVSANLAVQIDSTATFTAGYQGSVSQHTQNNGVHVGFDWRF